MFCFGIFPACASLSEGLLEAFQRRIMIFFRPAVEQQSFQCFGIQYVRAQFFCELLGWLLPLGSLYPSVHFIPPPKALQIAPCPSRGGSSSSFPSFPPISSLPAAAELGQKSSEERCQFAVHLLVKQPVWNCSAKGALSEGVRSWFVSWLALPCADVG